MQRSDSEEPDSVADWSTERPEPGVETQQIVHDVAEPHPDVIEKDGHPESYETEELPHGS